MLITFSDKLAISWHLVSDSGNTLAIEDIKNKKTLIQHLQNQTLPRLKTGNGIEAR